MQSAVLTASARSICTAVIVLPHWPMSAVARSSLTTVIPLAGDTVRRTRPAAWKHAPPASAAGRPPTDGYFGQSLTVRSFAMPACAVTSSGPSACLLPANVSRPAVAAGTSPMSSSAPRVVSFALRDDCALFDKNYPPNDVSKMCPGALNVFPRQPSILKATTHRPWPAFDPLEIDPESLLAMELARCRALAVELEVISDGGYGSDVQMKSCVPMWLIGDFDVALPWLQ